MPQDIKQLILAAGPAGIAPDALMQALQDQISRSTLNRHLSHLRESGDIKPIGNARATRYVTTTPFTRADIDAYFAKPANSRPLAPFREEYLEPAPGMDPDRAKRCEQIQALANPMDRKYLAEFIVDFSWGSSVLEGSSYSELDTEALVLYGERNPAKPVEDAVLALNHKRAGEYLWQHRELSVENICEMQALLTDDHAMPEVLASDHFLPVEKRGKPRVFEDVNLQNSAYLPPFRPGTSHAEDMLKKIVETAKPLAPVEAAVYLLTRIAYVQSFANGNKRTARLAANIPLLAAGLIPFSFVDVNKADYIRGMASFYELGSMHVIEQTFIQGYAKSIIRSSNLPAAMRVAGFDGDALARNLVEFINAGKRPSDASVRSFLR
ncbi:MAG TPA: Fic family protein [Burkholderiaceae bacterium]|jgi:hypothetical protein